TRAGSFKRWLGGFVGHPAEAATRGTVHLRHDTPTSLAHPTVRNITGPQWQKLEELRISLGRDHQSVDALDVAGNLPLVCGSLTRFSGHLIPHASIGAQVRSVADRPVEEHPVDGTGEDPRPPCDSICFSTNCGSQE